MSVLSILKFPDPRLHKVAKPVTEVTAKIRTLAADLAETMYAANGVGLAATQVDQHVRMVVVDTSETRDQIQVFINPEIIGQSIEKKEWEEGCLSVPEVYDIVTRPDRVRVRAMGLDGKTFEVDADELLAVCLQHEIDHLDGKVFVQHLSNMKQNRIRTKIRKQAKE
ncbi:MAG: peptide deformylase [Formosimonas sp.]|jgi:peptide deformylase